MFNRESPKGDDQLHQSSVEYNAHIHSEAPQHRVTNVKMTDNTLLMEVKIFTITLESFVDRIY